METTVTHDKEYQQFTVALGEDDAELAYSTPAENTLDFTHTYVPVAARGKGLANKLIEAGMQYAKSNNLKVIATCPVVAKYVEQHDEYKSLLKI
ncbi:GNAT family N-acetyltransferase [Pontibacter harenae]|uniref:GNAT family N-acetyltransferase n=1 Tax=Pontibacter harenae TaxID=2894083 RepID=UPI001E28F248|nr:GNAT family N-acetyltransferase [Pontibacter harenae]MCC9166254.1 N-acetyltransferase [Pontibacter harenae]